MKQKEKSTIGYQIRKILFGHIVALFVIDTVWLMAFAWTMESFAGGLISSIVFSFVYFTMLYSVAGEIADHDKKSYTRLNPNILKGVMFGVMISVINLLFLCMYAFIWHKFGNGASLTGIGAVTANICFTLWTMPYLGFMRPEAGNVTWYSAVIMTLLPILATGLGYFAACKGFYFSDKFAKFVYVKKDKK